MTIITEGMIKQALTLVRPAVQTMLRTKGLTWGPKYVEGSLRVRGMQTQAISFQFGTVPKEWSPKWGEKKNLATIARRKRSVAESGRTSTSTIIATKPWILRPGDFLYPGGVYRDGISVGISGAKSATDEAIAEMIISAIIMLVQLEIANRLKEGKEQI